MTIYLPFSIGACYSLMLWRPPSPWSAGCDAYQGREGRTLVRLSSKSPQGWQVAILGGCADLASASWPELLLDQPVRVPAEALTSFCATNGEYGTPLLVEHFPVAGAVP